MLDVEQRERNRYLGQKRLVDFLATAGRLRAGLDAATARDVLYALTCRDLYRQLVVVRGWSSSKYESWLGQTPVDSRITPGA